MRAILAPLVALLLAGPAAAQEDPPSDAPPAAEGPDTIVPAAPFLGLDEPEVPLNPEEALLKLGETRMVCGNVASVHFAETSKGKPTFVNLGKPYPDHVFTIVIWGDQRTKLPKPPESWLVLKRVCVTGTIGERNGKAQIVLTDPSRIRLVER